MKWLTRERVRIDRVASAWLILKFIDPDAQFMFAPNDGALDRAKREEAIPFVVPGAELSRHGDRITFDALLEKYQLGDQALEYMANIVRGADINTLRDVFPEARGLRAIVHGFFLLSLPDDEAIKLQLPLFDALYAYCREQSARHSR